MNYCSEKLNELRKKISERISEKRFSHILGVERCAIFLGNLLLPDNIAELSAAALLHDITKELPYEKQIELLKEVNFDFTEEDITTVGVLHSFTAPAVIKRDFPDFATENILSAVLNHTVGRADMSVFEKIIFISDYCEDTRKYDSCKNVRAALMDGIEMLSYEDRLKRLDKACLLSIDGALDALKRCNLPINSRMYLTRNSLIKK